MSNSTCTTVNEGRPKPDRRSPERSPERTTANEGRDPHGAHSEGSQPARQDVEQAIRASNRSAASRSVAGSQAA